MGGVVKTYGRAYRREPGLIRAQLIFQEVAQANLDDPGIAELIAAEITCREQFLLCMFLCGSDNGRYHSLKIDLANDMTTGADNILKTMVETMRMLYDYKASLWQMRRP